MVYRDGSSGIDEEEEEELVWDAEDNENNSPSKDVEEVNTSTNSNNSDMLVLYRKRIQELEKENETLRSQVSSLIGRVSDLETALSEKNKPIKEAKPSVRDSNTSPLPAVSPSESNGSGSRVSNFTSDVKNPNADTVSNSSEESGVVINKADLPSTSDDQFTSMRDVRKEVLPNNSNITSTDTVMENKSTPKKYLASLDDDEEDEDGWN